MNLICTKRQIPVGKNYLSPPPSPTFGEVVLRRKSSLICKICNESHPHKANCSSKPERGPRSIYPQCNICEGFHPKYSCYFEYAREVLFSYTPCDRCNGQIHIGFCKEALVCTTCETKHNPIDTCTRFTLDTSDNPCRKCKFSHTLHCHQDLINLEINIILWCNRCKIRHKFMKCVPHCLKCNRRHREDLLCPEWWDFCKYCNYSHHQSPCPYDYPPTSSTPKPPRSIKIKVSGKPSTPDKNDYNCPTDCEDPCCKQLPPLGTRV